MWSSSRRKYIYTSYHFLQLCHRVTVNSEAVSSVIKLRWITCMHNFAEKTPCSENSLNTPPHLNRYKHVCWCQISLQCKTSACCWPRVDCWKYKRFKCENLNVLNGWCRCNAAIWIIRLNDMQKNNIHHLKDLLFFAFHYQKQWQMKIQIQCYDICLGTKWASLLTSGKYGL